MRTLTLTFAAILIIGASAKAAETGITLETGCQRVADYIVSDSEYPMVPKISAADHTLVLTFVKPVQPMSEGMRKIGKLPVGTMVGHTTVYRLTSTSKASKVCMVSVQFSSPIARIASGSKAAENADVAMLRSQFVK